ncbi:MAG: hypothetical protein IH624_05040 [Phycisphaerae bacterium]|nr:hypothetical protein [Phycisphaerae bacterium]
MTLLAVCSCAMVLAPMGCQTRRQTGALAGAGVGALAGQAIGRSTTATVIGAGVGAGAGYIIGDRSDRRTARRYDYNQPTQLTGTRWRMVDLDMKGRPEPRYETYYVEFKPNGEMVSTINYADGTQEIVEERYRISGNTLIIHKQDYIINADYTMTDDTLTMTVLDDFRAVLRRV